MKGVPENKSFWFQKKNRTGGSGTLTNGRFPPFARVQGENNRSTEKYYSREAKYYSVRRNIIRVSSQNPGYSRVR